MQHKILGIIPARFQSTRFPGKPLALIQEKPMIQWVYEAVIKSELFSEVVIATDDDKIQAACEKFGARVIMTKSSHQSGTDRCAEIVEKLEEHEEYFEFVVNIQGDEPLIKKEQLASLIEGIQKEGTQICTLAKKITDLHSIENPNVVKLVKSTTGKALYFSRFAIPFPRTNFKSVYFKHIGIYAFQSNVLKNIYQLAPSQLEQAESLEQLRWLENNYTIQVEETTFESIGVDSPEDLEKINIIINN